MQRCLFTSTRRFKLNNSSFLFHSIRNSPATPFVSTTTKRYASSNFANTIEALCSMKELKSALTLYENTKTQQEIDSGDAIQTLLTCMYDEKYKGGDAQWVDEQTPLLHADLSSMKTKRLSILNSYMLLVGDFNQNYAEYVKWISKYAGIVLDNVPKNAIQVITKELNADVFEVYYSLLILLKQAMHEAFQTHSQVPDEIVSWRLMHKKYANRGSKNLPAIFNASDLLKKSMELYTFFKDIMHIDSQHIQPFVSSKEHFVILQKLLHIMFVADSPYIESVGAAEILKYNLIQYLGDHELRDMLYATALHLLPGALPLEILERRHHYCMDHKIPFKATSELYHCAIRIIVNTYEFPREKCIELIQQMQYYKLEISQDIYAILLKIMLKDGQTIECYQLFDALRKQLLQRNEKVDPNVWYNMISCAISDRDYTRAKQFINEATTEGAKTPGILAAMGPLISLEAEFVKRVIEIYLSDPIAGEQFRHTPHVCAMYVRTLGTLGEFDAAGQHAKQMISDILEKAKLLGPTAEKVVNITPIQEALISVCIQQKDYKRARHIFRQTNITQRTEALYCDMCTVFGQLGDVQSAINMVRDAMTQGLHSSPHFIASYLKLFTVSGDATSGILEWRKLRDTYPQIKEIYTETGKLRDPAKITSSIKHLTTTSSLRKYLRLLYLLKEFPSLKHPDIELD